MPKTLIDPTRIERQSQAGRLNSPAIPGPTPPAPTLPNDWPLIPTREEDAFRKFKKYADSLPWDGNSRNHNKANRAFIRAASLGIAEQTAMDVVVAAIQNAGGSDFSDLCNQVRSAYQFVGKKNTGNIQIENVLRWPARDLNTIEQIALKGPRLMELSALSPGRFDVDPRHTEQVVDILFPGNPLLCCGWSQRHFETKSRSEWRGCLAKMPFIVPSPMSAVKGRTKSDGKQSAHTLDNTGPRKFLVVEFDFKEKDKTGRDTPEGPMLRSLATHGILVPDLCASLLMHLAQYAPLAMVVHSGGKSLHGWFYCDGQPEDELRKFMSYAVMVGGDPATFTRNQFVRMPDGTRDDGARQVVRFFNREVLK